MSLKKNSSQLLLVFTRNPELGKVKSRLAKTIGQEKALNIYLFLLEHTVAITSHLAIDKQVHYSVKIRENDLWHATIYNKRQQKGNNLGERMEYAFAKGFEEGYEEIIIVGSDLFDLSQKDIENAFAQLEDNDYVIGPALDGGYYLLGMKQPSPTLFKNIAWGTNTVFRDTLNKVKNKKTVLLDPRNDIDYFEDLEKIPAFQKFL